MCVVCMTVRAGSYAPKRLDFRCVWVHAPGMRMHWRLYFAGCLCVHVYDESQILLSLLLKPVKSHLIPGNRVPLMYCAILATWSHWECALPAQHCRFYLEDSENNTKAFRELLLKHLSCHLLYNSQVLYCCKVWVGKSWESRRCKHIIMKCWSKQCLRCSTWGNKLIPHILMADKQQTAQWQTGQKFSLKNWWSCGKWVGVNLDFLFWLLASRTARGYWMLNGVALAILSKCCSFRVWDA